MPLPFLTAEWRYLAMLNYEIDPDVLQPFVPKGTELDSWNGKYHVSMVGFLFLKTRVRKIAVPWHRNFEEINLRFYVRRQGPEGWRRGVVFIKEIVPRLAIAAIARIFYNESYVALRCEHQLQTEQVPLEATYRWRFRAAWNEIMVVTKGEASLVKPHSLEEFITEHYWGYAKQRDGGCVEYQVEHPSWRIWQTSEAVLKCDVEGLYGKSFGKALSVKPASSFLAEGSPVAVYSGTRI